MYGKAFIAALLLVASSCKKPETKKPWSGKIGKVADKILRDSIDKIESGGQKNTEASPAPAGAPELGIKIVITSDRPSAEILEMVKQGSRAGRVFSLKKERLPDLGEIVLKDEVSHVELERPPVSGPAGPFQPLNLQARKSHRVPEFTATYPGNTGAITGAIFDEGAVRASHVEFRQTPSLPGSTRITNRTSRPLSPHSTHVAGTIGASGVDSGAAGMAPGVRLIVFDWWDHLAMLAAETVSLKFSSHSYGPMTGWRYIGNDWYWFGDTLTGEDGRFGKYDAEASELDRILAASPNLLTVAAAGNDRGEGPQTQPVSHFEIGPGGWQKANGVRPADGHQRGGLDTLGGLCLAKNSLCIGSIHDVTQAGSIQMTDYSSWGPADDLRIKPDLVANGQVLRSTADADDISYLDSSGTSMATPVVSGVSALLIQHFEKARGRSPRAAEIKAILIHTAVDAGLQGPDPVFGWGSINALQAGHVIARRQEHLIAEAAVSAGQEWSRTLTGVAGQPVRVTLVWSDPPAPPNAQGGNDATPTLQNDVDATLIGPDGKTYFPYSLNKANPLTPATRSGPNRADNVEVIDAPGQAGQWRVVARANVFKAAGPQQCAVVASGFVLP